MHESIYDEFVKKAADAAKNRIVGDPFKSGTQQGPQVNIAWLSVLEACSAGPKSHSLSVRSRKSFFSQDLGYGQRTSSGWHSTVSAPGSNPYCSLRTL